ncbi:MAG TPA: T9SS type A sorting domain-containing protein [Bacteroidia bacterium]|jgi:hypothetical protein|nr:T9SS type A sorting domain-containing protein [Bacteroidia bacterium]
MKKVKLLCISIFVISSSFSYGQSWQWGEQTTGGTCITTDGQGNAYLFDGFVTKYDPAGNVLWATVPPTNSIHTAGAGSSADNAGNVYLTGDFNDTIQFGPYTLLAPPFGIYLVKYSSSGSILWAKQTNYGGGAGPFFIEVISIATDKNGNALLTGVFEGNVVFGKDTLYSTSSDVFIAKYDTAGNVLWAKAGVSNPTNLIGGYSITSDNSGNVLVAGFFEGGLQFGAFPLNDYYSLDIFLVKYDANGNVLWANQGTTQGGGGGFAGNLCVTTDLAGYSYITGSLDDTVWFGNKMLISNNSHGSFYLTKYDPAGSVVWAKTSKGTWAGFALSSDTNNNIYFTGLDWAGMDTVNDTLQFGGFNYVDPPTTNYLNNYQGARFILKCDTSGHVLCSSIIYGGTGDCHYGTSIVSDPTGTNIYVAASSASDTMAFGPDTLIAVGYPYLARWNPCNSEEGIPPINSACNVVLYPNPNNGQFTIELSGLCEKSSVAVYNILGEQIYTAKINAATTQLDLSNNTSGIYLYTVLSETGRLVSDGKFIIQK